MRKLFLSITFIIAALALYAQPHSAIVQATVTNADTVIGKTAKAITIPDYLPQEYDYSYQVVPALSGAGDSVNIAVALWQANDFAGSAWTEIVSARDSATSTAGVLIEGTDAPGIRHRIVATGLALDSVKVKIYYVYKLPREFTNN
ncbi:hypothetical protein KAR91_14435 [Candidatus Pacearchaeota archaeon]|nr:hypothetical protein [Candidatus Pacearchaeota archaeon]